MGWIIVIVIAVSILVAVLNEKKRGKPDKDGNIHCKRCGCTNFVYSTDKYGRVITKCVNCGQSWKTV